MVEYRLPSLSSIIIVAILSLATTSKAIKLGEEVCISGYVMDLFCIELEVLLDNPLIPTLERPGEHSYHCLLDVDMCINSGYEILLDPAENGALYRRGVRLDDTGNSLVLDIGRRHGASASCSTCTEVIDNNVKGFRATVIGTISDLGTADVPPTLSVIEFGAESDLVCPEFAVNVADVMDSFAFEP